MHFQRAQTIQLVKKLNMHKTLKEARTHAPVEKRQKSAHAPDARLCTKKSMHT
jgi:hypothetical protein